MIGLPGAGKSTVAPLLAEGLGFGSVDLDQEIERQANRSIPAILEEQGEERFRDLESRVLDQVLDAGEGLVLACGGGILGRAGNRDALKERARVVWLAVDPATAAARLGPLAAGGRPLLGGSPLVERLRALLLSREDAYAAAADLVVETAGRSPEQIAGGIAAHVKASQAQWDRSGS
ncbi:MAG TPA: shikimate kinase [Candidatus Limnocylindrales bacterium]|nr:shikimate kinase [Candidatus Limnocylindrales bacterium]